MDKSHFNSATVHSYVEPEGSRSDAAWQPPQLRSACGAKGQAGAPLEQELKELIFWLVNIRYWIDLDRCFSKSWIQIDVLCSREFRFRASKHGILASKRTMWLIPWGFHTLAGWFIIENTIKKEWMMAGGTPIFRKPSYDMEVSINWGLPGSPKSSMSIWFNHVWRCFVSTTGGEHIAEPENTQRCAVFEDGVMTLTMFIHLVFDYSEKVW